MRPHEELERLLENAGWVRALGLELVGAGEAEDLTQDAWLAALERPADVRHPAAWLAGVVRKLAVRRRRGDERRGRRERAAARPEAEPGPDELVAEAELSRELIRSVTELDEPYRATVLLRFYRGLAPEEIARQQGVPSATVRTRLARALAKLRERLDRAHGGREAWALAFAAPGMLPTASSLGAGSLTGVTLTGGTLMTKTMLGGAALLAALLGYGIWQGRDEVEGESARDGQGVAAADAAPARASARPEPASVESRAEVNSREAVSASASGVAVSEVLLYGAVTDPAGAPVELETLGLEDPEGAVRFVSAASAGSYALAGLAPGNYTLQARAKGFVSRQEAIVLRADEQHQRVDLVLEPALSIPVRLFDETGGLIQLSGPGYRRKFDVVVTSAEPAGPLGGLGSPSRELGEFEPAGDRDLGRTAGHSGLLRLRAPAPLFVSVVMLDAILATQRVEGPVPELVFTLDQARLDALLGGVRARFLDALSGEPVSGGGASLSPPSVSIRGGPPREGAAAEFTGFAPGLHVLGFFHPGYAQFQRRVRVPPGRIEDLGDVAVWPKATLRGTILDALGRPLSASIRFAPVAEQHGPADVDLGTSFRAAAGSFELQRVPRGPVRLFVTAQDHALLVQDVDASSGALDGLVLQLEKGTPVSFRAKSAATNRQLTLADEVGRPLATWKLGNWTTATRLAPGAYQLWLGDAERVETSEVLVVGQEPVVRVIGAGP